MADQMSRELVEAFEGPRGKAELFEVVKTNPDRPHAENVSYEIVFNGKAETRFSLGDASIYACELSGDPRFSNEIIRAE